MSHWTQLPYIVRTAASVAEGEAHCHYFAVYAEASAFCDWLLSQGKPFSLTVKD